MNLSNVYTCPTCGTPLAPGAFVCPVCRAGGPGAKVASYGPGGPAAAASITRRANWALALSVIGLPFCCAPLSIVGAIIGITALRAAGKEKIAKPVAAIVSLGAAVVTILFSGAFIASVVIQTKKETARLEAVQARLKGKREIAVIDKAVACDLVEERLNEDPMEGGALGLASFTCNGEIEVKGNRAILRGAQAKFGNDKSFGVSACLAKHERWYVAAVKNYDDCSDAPAAYPASPGKLDEKQLADFEKKARATYATEEAIAIAAAFPGQIAKVREHIVSEREPKQELCDAAALARFTGGPDQRRKIDTVDFDLLGSPNSLTGSKTKPWEVLTTDRVAKLLEPGTSATDKQTFAREMSKETGSLILVYRATIKAWPLLTEAETLTAKPSFEAGEFEGWMMVYDYVKNESLCRGLFTFESADKTIRYKVGRLDSEKSKAKEAVDADFLREFRSASTKGIDKLASHKLRLGYLAGE